MEVQVGRQGLELLLRLPCGDGRPVRCRDAVDPSAVDVVVDEDIVHLRRGVDMALSQEQPPRHPVQEPVREGEAVHEKEVPVERRREHLAAIRVVSDQHERVAACVGQEHVRPEARGGRQVRPGLGDDDRVRLVHIGEHGLPCRSEQSGNRARGGVDPRERAVAVVRGRIHVADRGADPVLGLVVPQRLPFRGVEGARPLRSVEIPETPGRHHDALVIRVSVAIGQHRWRESSRSVARDVERVGNPLVLCRLTDRSEHRLGPIGGDDQDLCVQPRHRPRQLGGARRRGRVRGQDLW